MKILIVIALLSSLVYAEYIPSNLDKGIKRVCDYKTEKTKEQGQDYVYLLGITKGVLTGVVASHTFNGNDITHDGIILPKRTDSEYLKFICEKTYNHELTPEIGFFRVFVANSYYITME